MRKLLFTLLASLAMVAFVPGAALARHHHARHHHHHARIRHVTFGSTSGTSGTNSTSGSDETTGEDNEGAEPAETDNAGTVASFTPDATDSNTGVLTITLGDGSTVTGNVTSSTEIECQAPENEMQGEDTSSGGDDQSGDGGSSEDTSGEDGGSGDGSDNAQMCSTAQLTPGAVVHEAELEISGSGAIWQKVELVTS